MTKFDLLILRDSTRDEEVKKHLQWAISRIEILETALRDIEKSALKAVKARKMTTS